MANQFTEASSNIRERERIHQEVLKSQRPYPTNVSTPIGQQSEEYKKAKLAANNRRRLKKEA